MEEDKSKSQLKRDAKALQALGVDLAALTPSQLDKLMLPDALLGAVVAYQNTPSHVAKKRAMQRVGRVLRQIDDIDTLQDAYAKIIQANELNTVKFHLMEDWRARLMSDDNNALTDFLHRYPCDDIQQLRHAISQAKAERDNDKNKGATRTLFRLIRELIA